MRRTWLVALALVSAVLVVAGCSDQPVPPPAPQPTATPTPTPTPPPSTEPTKLVVGVTDLPGGFNPHLLADSSAVTRSVADLVLPSVFHDDAQGVPQLDTSIVTSAKVTSQQPFTVSYEINLEASWSTNAPIAAEDFVYLWEQMRGERGTVDGAGYRAITAVRSRAGGKAVDVEFAQPYPQWQHLFSGLLPAHILKDAPGSWIGATRNGLPASGGPFKVDNVDRGRGEVVLARNDVYWGTPSVADQLVLRKLDDAGLATGLSNGDVAVAIPNADPQLRTVLNGLNPAPRTQPAPQPVVEQLGMRADGGPTGNPYVREAMSGLTDRDALRAAVAPEALPADAFGLAPSQPGYAATAPPRPDAAATAALLGQAGWTRAGAGPWEVDGKPVKLVIGAAAERPQELKIAQNVAAQLTAQGIATSVVAPPAVDLYAAQTVPATPPTTTAPRPTSTATPTPATSPTPTTSASPTTAPSSGSGVTVDLMVLPHPVGGDPADELASAYGCPQPTSLVADPPRSPTRFCFPPLEPLFDELQSANPRPDTAAFVEKVLWQQAPVLPLFQPVTIVVSTAAGDTATGIGPGPLSTGPLTGAQRWQPVRR